MGCTHLGVVLHLWAILSLSTGLPAFVPGISFRICKVSPWVTKEMESGDHTVPDGNASSTHFPERVLKMQGVDPCAMPGPSNALAFLRVVGKLKELKRTGWVHRGVALPESVSDHMYRMAAASFLITDPTLDRSRIMKLAVVHDLAEALAGDIAPHQGVSKEDKRRLEEQALEEICGKIGSDAIGEFCLPCFLPHSYNPKLEIRRNNMLNFANRLVLHVE
ncbi:unnamed protein product [Choristocarpus tenellus]